MKDPQRLIHYKVQFRYCHDIHHLKELDTGCKYVVSRAQKNLEER